MKLPRKRTVETTITFVTKVLFLMLIGLALVNLTSLLSCNDFRDKSSPGIVSVNHGGKMLGIRDTASLNCSPTGDEIVGASGIVHFVATYRINSR